VTASVSDGDEDESRRARVSSIEGGFISSSDEADHLALSLAHQHQHQYNATAIPTGPRGRSRMHMAKVRNPIPLGDRPFLDCRG
jgi:hypothetical protein